jgi:uncharacterized protein YciI
MQTRTLVIFGAGPAWVKGRGARQQAYWDEHAAFIDDLTERGLLVAGGPFGDESGALNILAGAVETLDVVNLYAEDPFVVNGIFVLERVVQWLVFVDNWAAATTSPSS